MSEQGTIASQPSGANLTGQAQEKAREVTDQAREQASQAVDKGKNYISQQVDQRSKQAGELLSSSINDIRGASKELRNQGNEKPADLIDRVATKGEDLADYLRQSDSDRILSDVESFARRQPIAVALGGLVLGFAAARFLKASSERRYAPTPSGGSSFDGPAYGSMGTRSSNTSNGGGFTQVRSADEVRAELRQNDPALADAAAEPVSDFSNSPVAESR